MPFKYNCIKIGPEKNNYINASPIKAGEYYFVATQGPKQETIDDFWTMVWELKSKVIVMLCDIYEGNENKEKCAKYWDVTKEKFKITLEKMNFFNPYYVNELKLINLSTKEERIVYHINYQRWPDHGVPDEKVTRNFDAFREMIEQVDINNSNEKDTKPPVIIHCSAGAGRTGTFIAMYLLEKEIIKQIEDKCPIIRINVFNLVRKFKEMRMYMVQTTMQYLYIYSFVEKVLKEENR